MQPTCSRSLSLVQSSFLKRSAFLFPTSHVYARQIRHPHSSFPRQSASAKLFADAAKEAEGTIKSTRLSVLEQQHENWTGDEKMEDAVLRMLIDKYKPLRTGAIQSAEQKIKQNAPKLARALGPLNGSSSTIQTPLVNLKPTTTGSWATEPLLPSSQDHQPWHTRYKAPSHDESNVKVKIASLPPPVARTAGRTTEQDDKTRRLERERTKRTQHATRLTDARESMLDYKMGVKGGRAPAVQTNETAQANPVSLKGWSSLIEDKIEKARKAGLFDTVKGRGLPLNRSMEEYNPFIAREEFLMNRIVQRNNAAPPWVEVQIELETAVNTFRQILRQAWIRRATRMLVSENRQDVLNRLTFEDVKAFRDAEWLEKERSYHTKAVEELNSLVRKYNGLAPYAVRRAYYMQEAEIGRLYDDCASDIFGQVSERKTQFDLLDSRSGGRAGHTGGSSGEGRAGNASRDGVGLSFFQWLRVLFRRWLGC